MLRLHFPNRLLFPDDHGSGGGDPVSSANEELESLLVNGKEERLTREQIRKEAQKARGVLPQVQSDLDRLRREHEELTSKSTAAFSFIDELDKVWSGGGDAQSALRKMAQMLQTTPEELAEKISSAAGVAGKKKRSARPDPVEDPDDDEVYEDAEEDDDPPPRRRSSSERDRASRREPISLDDLSPELRAAIAHANGMRLGNIREGMYAALDERFAADPELSKIMKDAAKATVARRLGQRALQRRVNAEKQEYGPRLLKDIADEVRQDLQDLGIRDEPSKKRSVIDDRPELAALGLNTLLGDPDVSAELHRPEEPKRVSMMSGEYRKGFAKRLFHRLLSSERGEQ